MSLVVKGSDLAGLYIGTPETAWRAAADLSAQLHIVYKDKPTTSCGNVGPIIKSKS